jgi:hypothetical protein
MGDKSRGTFDKGRFSWLQDVAKDPKLTASALRVAIVICDRLNYKRNCAWPSMNYIGKHTRLSRASVFRAIGLLENRGWLSRESGGRLRSNEYRIRFGPVDAADDGEALDQVEASLIPETVESHA